MNAWSFVLVAAICLVATAEPTEAGCRRCCRILCHCGQQKATTDGGSSEASQPKASASNVPGAGQSPQPIMTSGTGSGVTTSSTGLDKSVDVRMKRIEECVNRLDRLERLPTNMRELELSTYDKEAALAGIFIHQATGRFIDRVEDRLIDRVADMIFGQSLGEPYRPKKNAIDDVLPPVEPPPVNLPNGDHLTTAVRQAVTDAINSPDFRKTIDSSFKSAIKESYQSDDFKNAVKAVIGK